VADHPRKGSAGATSAGLRWFAAEASDAAPWSCPNCGASVPRRPVLQAETPAGEPLLLLACDACGAHCFDELTVADYGGEPTGGAASLAFYLQQGADSGGMAMRLAALGRPPGTRYLEIGCGFGLGLDFARRGLGWVVEGLDPSPFAAEGRRQLGLPIASRYLLPDDPLGSDFDVVHASEVLEHVPDPQALLRTLRGALRPDGTLVLTTPAAEAITPGTSPGQLVPLLSAGWHMVIQTAASLEMLLRRAGFEAVDVRRHGAQLIARAGPLPPAAPAGRAPYIRWLAAAAGAVPVGSDLGLGLAARLYRECSGAGDDMAAARAWRDLDDAVATRFGHGLAHWRDSPPDALSLPALVAREPLCLAGVLLHRGVHALQHDEPAEGWLAGAVAAATRLRTALRAIGAEDGDAEHVGFAATRELIQAAARRGEAGIADRIAALRQAGGGHHADAAARACFVTLVNAGALDEARRLDAAAAPALAALRGGAALAHADASLIFCAAMLELQDPEGNRAAAVEWLEALLAALPGRAPASAASLHGPATEAVALGLRLLETPAADREAFINLVNAGALDEARRLDAVVAPALAALRGAAALDHADASLVFCGAMLELQDPEGNREGAVEWLEALLEALPARAPASAAILHMPAMEAAALGLRLLDRPEDADALLAGPPARRSVS
jgi:SAM-dependent methyltransferase